MQNQTRETDVVATQFGDVSSTRVSWLSRDMEYFSRKQKSALSIYFSFFMFEIDIVFVKMTKINTKGPLC